MAIKEAHQCTLCSSCCNNMSPLTGHFSMTGSLCLLRRAQQGTLIKVLTTPRHDHSAHLSVLIEGTTTSRLVHPAHQGTLIKRIKKISDLGSRGSLSQDQKLANLEPAKRELAKLEPANRSLLSGSLPGGSLATGSLPI